MAITVVKISLTVENARVLADALVTARNEYLRRQEANRKKYKPALAQQLNQLNIKRRRVLDSALDQLNAQGV